MATKDISDLQVVQAYAEMERQMNALSGSGKRFEYSDEILERTTGQPQKVCERAMERAHGRGLVEYGMWLRGGWLTDKGKALLTSNGEVRGASRLAGEASSAEGATSTVVLGAVRPGKDGDA